MVCDGMADRPLKELKGRTPLEAARTPNMDMLAEKGVSGIVDTIAPGIKPGSDTAHLAILGYDPLEVYTGRGPLEAAGAGMDVLPGEIAFRCNFATLDEKGVVIDRRAGRINHGTTELAAAINKITLPDARIRFTISTGHRGALVLSGEGLSDKISDSDPHSEGSKPLIVKPLDDSKEAKRTADILNFVMEEATRVLSAHEVNLERIREGRNPANALLIRGAGIAPEIRPFQEKYGLKAGCIATVALVRGVGRFCGLEVLGADPGSSIDEIVKQALKGTAAHDLVLLNIKGADDASHDGDAGRKIKVIEEIDEALGMVLDFTEQNYVAVMADHTSAISRRDHCGDPVPLLITGPEVRADKVKTFSERDAAEGGLCRLRGTDVMNILVDLMNRSEKFGA